MKSHKKIMLNNHTDKLSQFNFPFLNSLLSVIVLDIT